MFWALVWVGGEGVGSKAMYSCTTLEIAENTEM